MAMRETFETKMRKLEALGLETGPVITIHLLRFRTTADYTGYPDETPCSGREAYQRYLNFLGPIGAELGAKRIFKAPILQTMTAPEEEEWDVIGMVEWPSIASIKALFNHKDFQSAMRHRQAAIQDGRFLISLKSDAETE